MAPNKRGRQRTEARRTVLSGIPLRRSQRLANKRRQQAEAEETALRQQRAQIAASHGRRLTTPLSTASGTPRSWTPIVEQQQPVVRVVVNRDPHLLRGGVLEEQPFAAPLPRTVLTHPLSMNDIREAQQQLTDAMRLTVRPDGRMEFVPRTRSPSPEPNVRRSSRIRCIRRRRERQEEDVRPLQRVIQDVEGYLWDEQTGFRLSVERARGRVMIVESARASLPPPARSNNNNFLNPFGNRNHLRFNFGPFNDEPLNEPVNPSDVSEDESDESDDDDDDSLISVTATINSRSVASSPRAGAAPRAPPTPASGIPTASRVVTRSMSRNPSFYGTQTVSVGTNTDNDTPTSSTKSMHENSDYASPSSAATKTRSKVVLDPKDMGVCTICHDDTPRKPVACYSCRQVVGCRYCVKKWFLTTNISCLDEPAPYTVSTNDRNHKRCPLCRYEWGESMKVVSVVCKQGDAEGSSGCAEKAVKMSETNMD